MLYLAIDLHINQLTTLVLDEAGDAVLRRQVSTRPEVCRGFLRDVAERAKGPEGFVAMLETCGFEEWLIRELREAGCRRIILVQPTKKKKQKDDRRDANELAELMWVNRDRIRRGERLHQVREVEIATDEDRRCRRLTKLERDLKAERTEHINATHHILHRRNVHHECPTKGIDTKRAGQWLRNLDLPEVDRLELDYHLARWELIDGELEALHARICREAEAHPIARGMLPWNGVGASTALAIGCRIGTIERFRRPGSLVNFFGIAPGLNDSGERTGRIGSITKRGSAIVRFYLGQLAMHAIRVNERLRKWHRGIKRRRGSKTALVAMMRKLTHFIWHMVHDGVAYDARFNPEV
jgi:transposase